MCLVPSLRGQKDAAGQSDSKGTERDQSSGDHGTLANCCRRHRVLPATKGRGFKNRGQDA